MIARVGVVLLLAGLLTGCGGGSSNSTGPTAAVPQATDTEVAAPPASAPKSTSSGHQFRMTASVTGSRPGIGGCVSIQVDSPSNNTSCGGSVAVDGDEGTRGTVTATPDPGYRFVKWQSFSSDCGGESVNPCSFAFDRNKTMYALFSGTSAPTSGATPSTPASSSAPVSSSAPHPQFTVTARAQTDSAYLSHLAVHNIFNSSNNTLSGCVIIDGSACGYPPLGAGYQSGGYSYGPVSNTAAQGTHGTVTAVPGKARFLGWTADSADCAGSTRNPCSFVYDRNKTITALFGW
jgi:Divergent InlB B-repeat domain